MLRNRGIRTRRADQVAAPTQPSAAADQAAQPAPEPVRVFGATGLAAMDVLPARSGGRGLLRRRSAPAERPLLADSGVPVTTSGVLVGTGSGVAVGTGSGVLVGTGSGVAVGTGSGVLVGTVSGVAVGTAQAESSFAGIATTPAGPALAEVPAPESIAWSATPTQALPVAAAPTVAAPQPAPSSLFAPASAPVPEVSEIVPAQPVAPIAAPSSLFLPAPVESEGAAAPAERSSEPASVGAPVAPGLTAAQSLRERSAMASEALSELSALSTYTAQGGVPAQPRRAALVPPAEATGQPAQQPGEEPLGARRGTRNAADVRSMLSGARSTADRGLATGAGAVPVHAQP